MVYYNCTFTVEEGVDGEAFIALVEDGRSEQLQRLGLKRLKEEMKFRRMIKRSSGDSGAATVPPPSSSSSSAQMQAASDRKLTIKEIGQLKAEEKAVYLVK